MSFYTEQQPARPRSRSFDKKTEDGNSQLNYDLVCVGFGATALPLAAALADRNAEAKVLFVERESHFHWHPAHILPDQPVGSSFLRDLTTTQNPRSRFTFINYLHATNQLIRFTNNSKTVPSRRLMGEYLRWAANNVEKLGWVSYGQEVVRVRPLKANRQERVAKWSIEMRNTKTHAPSIIQTKRLVLATGATPHIPRSLAGAPLVLHSSNSAHLLENVRSATQPLNFAVIGADQEAAEVFEHLHTSRSRLHTATMFYADSALRPEEAAPNVQDILDRPESMPGNLPPEVRHRRQNSTSHSPQVNLRTLESLYEAQYTQKIHERDPRNWRFHMRPWSEVVRVEPDGAKGRLVIKNPTTGEISATSTPAFDIIIAATGYRFAVAHDMLDFPAGLLDRDVVSVDAHYHVNFRKDALAPGSGLWLLGSLDDGSTRADNFTCMAERAHRAAQSILKELQVEDQKTPRTQQYAERAMF